MRPKLNKKELLNKIKEAGLVGRGGASFPTHLKWQRMLETPLESPAQEKLVVCNVSEGEPGVKKDFYILKNAPEEVFNGMRLALDFLDSKKGYFNFNADYWQRLQARLEPIIDDYKKEGYEFIVFEEEPSYIGGETGSLLNAIEGKRVEPRLKPPSPSLAGINGNPVLLHNVETFYNVSLVSKDQFENKRFYTVGGQAEKPGVYYLADDLTVAEVLRQTDNYPDFNFFAQVGGGASGPVWNQEQLAKNPATGTGSIEIYATRTPAHQMLRQWFRFYMEESCGKCAPCRQGTYELYQSIKEINDDDKIDWTRLDPVIETLERTAFCDLGRSLAIPLKTYRTNVLQNVLKNEAETKD